MSTEMKTGLVLSGGGAVGAYQAGVVKALAECGTQISMVSGASIGAFNGAIIAASTDLSEAAVRLEALWDHLGNNQVLSVNRLVYFSFAEKIVPGNEPLPDPRTCRSTAYDASSPYIDNQRV